MSERPIYFSFFMFDANLRLYDEAAVELAIEQMQVLAEMGYSGFELHTGRTPEFHAAFPSYADEVAGYRRFRERVNAAGLGHIALATNVGAEVDRDPSSPDPAVRQAGLDYLKSRIDITAALGGEIMMGPVVVPYGPDVVRDPDGAVLESDALHEAIHLRYETAAPVLDELGAHAAAQGVKVAIEPITHWETQGPNTLDQVLRVLRMVPSQAIGVVLDSAHETLDGAGPERLVEQLDELVAGNRLHYVQASPPDRGSLVDSWLPWQQLFPPVLERYHGPVAIEIFNARPIFATGFRLSRRKYWVPGVDEPSERPSAYDVARASLERLRQEFARIPSEASTP